MAYIFTSLHLFPHPSRLNIFSLSTLFLCPRQHYHTKFAQALVSHRPQLLFSSQVQEMQQPRCFQSKASHPLLCFLLIRWSLAVRSCAAVYHCYVVKWFNSHSLRSVRKTKWLNVCTPRLNYSGAWSVIIVNLCTSDNPTMCSAMCCLLYFNHD